MASPRHFYSELRKTSGDRSVRLPVAYREDSVLSGRHSSRLTLSLALYRSSGRLVRRKLAVVTVAALVCIVIYGLVTKPWINEVDDYFDVTFEQFWHDRSPEGSSVAYPAESFGNVQPIPCHSHNDYSRQTPLFAALGAGCISTEADIWLKNGDLYIGHARSSLRENATLRTMYINPLTSILQAMNPAPITSPGISEMSGVFYKNPAQVLTLLVDFKTPSAEAWSLFLDQLTPLREAGWLTHWNGMSRVNRPIIVVASGSIDFDLIVANNTYRDVFFDAPLEALEDDSDGNTDMDHTLLDNLTTKSVYSFKYNPSNSHFASVKFSKAIGATWFSMPSSQQIEIIRKQINDAKDRDLVSRYWGVPRWPRDLRDGIWDLLVREEVGLLSVDDLKAVTELYQNRML